MVNFIDIDPSEIDTSRSGRRGRVSYPIIKGFMERNVKVSKLDPESLGDKNPQYLRSVLTSYIKTHNMPIKLFAAGGDLHLMRLDLNNGGTPIVGYKNEERATEGAAGHLRDQTPVPLDASEVAKRFEEDKHKTTT